MRSVIQISKRLAHHRAKKSFQIIRHRIGLVERFERHIAHRRLIAAFELVEVRWAYPFLAGEELEIFREIRPHGVIGWVRGFGRTSIAGALTALRVSRRPATRRARRNSEDSHDKEFQAIAHARSSFV